MHVCRAVGSPSPGLISTVLSARPAAALCWPPVTQATCRELAPARSPRCRCDPSASSCDSPAIPGSSSLSLQSPPLPHQRLLILPDAAGLGPPRVLHALLCLPSGHLDSERRDPLPPRQPPTDSFSRAGTCLARLQHPGSTPGASPAGSPSVYWHAEAARIHPAVLY